MIRSGEWFGAQALNAIRHHMESRHAIDIVTARRSSLQGSAFVSTSDGRAPLLRTLAAVRPLKAAA
jgi:hypothetical protein